MHLRVIAPVLPSRALVDKALAEYREAVSFGTMVSVDALANGTSTIESDYDIALAAPDTVRLIVQAERDGVDVCTVACFSDPGVAAARERVQIPVIGEGQAALVTASLLGRRLCIVTTWNQCIPRIRRLAASHRLGARLVAVCAANLGVMALDEASVPKIVDKVVRAVERGGADVVVMACTGTGLAMAASVEAGLRERVGRRVPVVDPVKAAAALAEGCVATGMRHSKIAYPSPANVRPEFRFAGAAE